jgi:hypothetical protein
LHPDEGVEMSRKPVFLVYSGLNDRMLLLMVVEIHNSREKHGKEGGNAH